MPSHLLLQKELNSSLETLSFHMNKLNTRNFVHARLNNKIVHMRRIDLIDVYVGVG